MRSEKAVARGMGSVCGDGESATPGTYQLSDVFDSGTWTKKLKAAKDITEWEVPFKSTNNTIVFRMGILSEVPLCF